MTDLFVTSEELRYMYEVKKMSDIEIAVICKKDRTWVARVREMYGIPTRTTIHDIAVEYVTKELVKMGHSVNNVKDTNKSNHYDLLIDDKIRVQVMGANWYDTGFRYMFTVSGKDKTILEDGVRMLLPNGRIRKLYSKTCDSIVFVGVKEDEFHVWVMPSSDLRDTQQSIKLPISSKSRYSKYYKEWSNIKG
ncbi:hypothetical protein [Bacillus sp. NEAU-Y102]